MRHYIYRLRHVIVVATIVLLLFCIFSIIFWDLSGKLSTEGGVAVIILAFLFFFATIFYIRWWLNTFLGD